MGYRSSGCGGVGGPFFFFFFPRIETLERPREKEMKREEERDRFRC